VLPRLAEHGVRFIQIARSQRRTTRAGGGVIVLDDSRQPERLYTEGPTPWGRKCSPRARCPSAAG
jgi:hypothetical protein